MARESRKQAARRPRPPFPRAASCSWSMISSIRKPRSLRPSVNCQQTNLTCQNLEDLTLSNILEPNIQHSIIKRSPHQELQTEIIDSLPIRKRLSLLRPVPLRNQTVSERKTSSRIRRSLVTVKHASRQCGLDMADNFPLEVFLGGEAFSCELLPCCSLGLGDGSCWEKGLATFFTSI